MISRERYEHAAAYELVRLYAGEWESAIARREARDGSEGWADFVLWRSNYDMQSELRAREVAESDLASAEAEVFAAF